MAQTCVAGKTPETAPPKHIDETANDAGGSIRAWFNGVRDVNGRQSCEYAVR